jgi:hypothetical protein
MRQVLRFPVGPQFRKILEDDHEWLVITDLHLRILKAKRGKIDVVPGYVEQEAFAELDFYRKTDRKIRVYDLHTHPGSFRPTPSSGDMVGYIKDTINKSKIPVLKGFIIAGFGVITKNGIMIIKLPTNKTRLHNLDDDFGHDYRKESYEKYDKRVLDLNREVDDHTDDKITNRAHLDTFRKLAKNEKDIKFRTVQRPTLRSLRRLR